MAKASFYQNYYELIAYYQYIEMHLRGICAALLADEEKGWLDQLDDIETDPLGKTIQKIQALQTTCKTTLFTQDDFDALDLLRHSRNYWVHQCFIGDKPVIIRNDGTVKRAEHAAKLIKDLDAAITWDKKITEIERPLLPNHVPL